MFAKRSPINVCLNIILLGFVLMCSNWESDAFATVARQGSTKADVLRDILGVTHVAGKYYLTDKDYLNEGADQILALGSRVIKVWFYAKRHEHPSSVYPYNSNWPKVESLVEGAQLPYFKTLFNKPFTTYILAVTSLGRADDYWRTGISDEQVQDEQRQFYELTKYLLTTYQNTGKIFVLQHWEGDWMIRGMINGHFDGSKDPTPQAIKNMIIWLNARQSGVDNAKKEIGQNGVHVYHAAEVNRVVSSMRDGRPNMVNKVLPYTHLDLVSYSAWDSATKVLKDPNLFLQSLDFIAKNAPDSPDFGAKNVYLGEFGWPENLFDAEKIPMVIPNVVNTALKWGCPYVIYWQLYCNDATGSKKQPPMKNNEDVRGFWLIRPDGSKSWVWHYFYELLNGSK